MNPSPRISGAVQPVKLPEFSDIDESFNFSSEEELSPTSPTRELPRPCASQGPSHLFPSADLSPNSYFRTAFPSPEPTLSCPAQALSFDGFLQAIGSLSAQNEVTINRKTILIPETKKGEMRRAKELALEKEQGLLLRKTAVVRLQRWWKRRLVVLMVERRMAYTRFKTTMHRTAVSRAIFLLARMMTKAYPSLLQRNRQILNRYRNSCALTIQRHWKSFQNRKLSRRKQRRNVLLQAILVAWKTRKVMKSWPVQEIVNRLKRTTEDRSLLVTELLQTFREEYKCGKWMRSRRIQPFQRARNRHPREESDVSSHSPVRITALGLESPSVNDTHLLSETVSSTKSMRNLPTAGKRILTSRPFLKRRSQKVDIQPVNWNGIRSKLSCWVAPQPDQQKKRVSNAREVVPNPSKEDLGRNSLEEFMEIERMSKETQVLPRKKLPIPLSDASPGPVSSSLDDFPKQEKAGNHLVRLSTIKSQAGSDDEDIETQFATFDQGKARRNRGRKCTKESISTAGDREFQSDSDSF